MPIIAGERPHMNEKRPTSSRRRATAVGKRLESSRVERPRYNRRRLISRVGLLLGLFVLTVWAFPRQQNYDLTVAEGTVWKRGNLVAPFEFAIYKREADLEAEWLEVEEDARSVLTSIPNAAARAESMAEELRTTLGTALAAYTEWQIQKQRAGSDATKPDSLAYLQARNAVPLNLNRRQWGYLLSSHISRIPGLGSSTRAPAGERALDEWLLDQVVPIHEQIHTQRLLDVPLDSLPTRDAVIRDQRNRTERLVPRGELRGPDDARELAAMSFRQVFGNKPDTVSIALSMFDHIFQPALRFDQAETRRALQERRALISETRGVVQEGEIIIRDGEVVDEQIAAKLHSLQRALSDRSGNFMIWRLLLGQAFLALACYLVLFTFLHIFRPGIWQSWRHFGLILILILMFVGMFAVVVRTPASDTMGLLVPVAMVPIMLAVVFDSRLAVVATVSVALLGGCILHFDFEYVAITIFSGTLAAFSVRGIRTRSQFMLTAGVVLLTYVATLSIFQLFRVFDLDRFLMELAMVAGNGILLLLTLPLLWIFERAFRVTTDVTLLELSDTNQPLLRKLSTTAPGSFSHSLQVANLAEAAADAIGANALLTRVGALYHDIGKMLKPEYFVENQAANHNPHDELTPQMSALVIVAHVKDGLELAKKWRLPQVIVDFIPMHHGTTRIEFFYRKALEQKKEKVLESDFRYPGPRPNTKETGILMLADSVEAACKSVVGSGKATPNRFDNLVSSIFKARLDDGQMDDCPLTIADLTRIRAAFVSLLSGIYHSRVKYPGQDNKEPRGDAPKHESPNAIGQAPADGTKDDAADTEAAEERKNAS